MSAKITLNTFLCFCFISCSIASGQAITRVQYTHIYSYPGNSVTFPSHNSAGNAIVVMASWYLGPGTPTISDTQGNTYTLLPPLTGGGAGNGEQTSILIWYALNIAAGANTVTISGAGIDVGMTAVEYSGIGGVGTTSTLPYFGGTPTTTPTSNGFTPSAGSLLFVAFADETNPQNSIAAGSGYTLIQGDGNHVDIEEDKVNSSAGPQTASISVDTATWSWAMYVVEFLPATGGSPPIGTVLWTNPGDGSGFSSIVPAVPSASGVADIFGLQNDGTVAAITSDGATAWSADVSQAGMVVPDFLGGLVLVQQYGASSGNNSIVKLDGATGQAYPSYFPNPATTSLLDAAVHTDGTVFALQQDQTGNNIGSSLVGIDPTSGTQKFSVSLEDTSSSQNALAQNISSLIVAGDGRAYLTYSYGVLNPQSVGGFAVYHFMLLRVDSSGNFAKIHVTDWTPTGDTYPVFETGLITNADTGILLSWALFVAHFPESRPSRPPAAGPRFRGVDPKRRRTKNFQFTGQPPASTGMAITSGTSLSLIGAPTVSGQVTAVIPGVQREDGSFVGTVGVGDPNNPQYNMVAFGSSGSLLWTVTNDQPQIATADGGVVGQSGTHYDQGGTATGQIDLTTQSWTGNDYQLSGSALTSLVASLILEDGASYWAAAGGNPSGNGTAFIQCPCLIQTAGAADPQSATRPGSTTPSSNGSNSTTSLIMVGDSGLKDHNVGHLFDLAGQTQESALQSIGNAVVTMRVSSVLAMNAALTTNGLIDGSITFFGHGGQIQVQDVPLIRYWALHPGENTGQDTNLSIVNVDELSSINLGPNATITLNACHAGAGGKLSVAQAIAKQLNRPVLAYPVGMYFSSDPTPRIFQKGMATPTGVPVYMVPNANGLQPIRFPLP
ncbi:MAG TPA: PQQ-binding-like beta-propeller repeat protein [Bryobacteraceae bacterium]|nr:PQQ-binding-like beta-propeller repeat protein [Bryobacteraceae bacterium]